MSPSFLSTTGKFVGTDYLRAQNPLAENHPAEIDQVLIGGYQIDTTILISKAPRYVYPHVNVTKKVLKIVDDQIFYRINVTNDGGKTLEPVVVVDLLPPEATFMNSTLKPTLLGRIVSWSLIALPSGGLQTIDLRARLSVISPDVINKVQVASKYQNQTVTAEAFSDPYKTTETTPAETVDSRSMEVYTYGEWNPPSCMNLGSNISCCEKDIDQYYNNLSECCYNCP